MKNGEFLQLSGGGLQALDSLGAGFSLASHDMDIRGSGNILGEEQSGHIKEVGIALYHHMLEEEIARIKAGAAAAETDGKAAADWSPQIVTGVPIMIPESYVRDLGVRLGLYKRIGGLETRCLTCGKSWLIVSVPFRRRLKIC